MAKVEQISQATEVRKPVVLLIMMVLGHALKHILNAGLPIIIPELKAGMGLSNAAVGTLSTVRQVTGGVLNLPAGYISDRYSARYVRVLVLTMVGVGVFTFALGRAPNFGYALVAASLINGSITFWHPAAIGTLSRAFQLRRGFAISLHGAGGSTGEVLGPLLAGALLLALGWRQVLQLAVFPAFLTAILIIVLLRGVDVPAAPPKSMGSYLTALWKLLRNPSLLTVLAVTAASSGATSVMMTFLPIYIREDLGYSPGVVGGYIAVAQVAGIGSQPVMGHLSDRLGRKAVLVPALAGMCVTILGVYLATSGVLFVLALAVMGAFLFSLMALMVATASDLAPPDVQSTIVSLVFGSGILLSGIVPYFAGLIADVHGVRTTFLFAASIAFVAATLALTIRGQRRGAAAPAKP